MKTIVCKSCNKSKLAAIFSATERAKKSPKCPSCVNKRPSRAKSDGTVAFNYASISPRVKRSA